MGEGRRGREMKVGEKIYISIKTIKNLKKKTKQKNPSQSLAILIAGNTTTQQSQTLLKRPQQEYRIIL